MEYIVSHPNRHTLSLIELLLNNLNKKLNAVPCVLQQNLVSLDMTSSVLYVAFVNNCSYLVRLSEILPNPL